MVLIYCQKNYKYEPNLMEYMGNEELNKTNSFYNSMKKLDDDVYIPNESAYFSESIFIKAKEKNNTNKSIIYKIINIKKYM